MWVGSGGLEPGVLVRGVVENEVDDDPHVPLVSLGNQFAEIIDGSVFGENLAIVGDVISTIEQGGGVEGWKPQRINPEPLEIVEFGDQAFKVTDTIAIRIGKSTNHYLVEDGAAIPGGVVLQTRLAERNGEAQAKPSEDGGR